MAIPPLDDRGLLPPGEHECLLEDVPKHFCTNVHREILWNSLCHDFIPVLHVQTKNADDTRMVLGGSFFSDKPHPADIEATLIFPETTPPEECWRSLVTWKQNHMTWKEQFKVDYYPTLPGDNDFALFFRYVGPKTAEAKGLHEKDLRGTLALQSW